MKFYRLFHSIDAKVVGTADNQISELIAPTTINSPKSLMSLEFKPAQRDTEVPKGVLHKKAKLVDMIPDPQRSLFYYISDKLRHILAAGICVGVEFLPTNLIVKGQELDYWVLNPYQTDYPFLDMERSEFVYADLMTDVVLRKATFKTAQEFLQTWKETKEKNRALNIPFEKRETLHIHTIAIRPDSDVDFFSLRPVSHGWNGYFVSENMKEKIEAAECTGMVFRELNGPLFD